MLIHVSVPATMHENVQTPPMSKKKCMQEQKDPYLQCLYSAIQSSFKLKIYNIKQFCFYVIQKVFQVSKSQRYCQSYKFKKHECWETFLWSFIQMHSV